MIKEIKHKDRIFAIVINSREQFNQGHNFITNPFENLQVNVFKQEKGSFIPTHYHNFIERKIFGTQEVLYVEKGIMRVRIFNPDGETLGDETLGQGDLIILLRGGHGFEFLEDSKIIYVKQGPYISQEVDKKTFK